MPHSLYYQAAETPAGVSAVGPQQLGSLMAEPGKLNIITGSMALYAELQKKWAL